MRNRQPHVAMPSRRALFKSRVKKRTIERQVISSSPGTLATLKLSDSTPIPPLAVRALTRMGFGPRRTDSIPGFVAGPGEVFSDDFEAPAVAGRDDVAYFRSQIGRAHV